MSKRKEDAHYTVLKIMYPNATRGQIKKLNQLCLEKKVKIPIPKPTTVIDNIMCSIVRHDYTHYEDMIQRGIKRESARFIINDTVTESINYLKKPLKIGKL